MKKIIALILCFCVINYSFGQITITEEIQDSSFLQVYPTHWWVGMKNPNLQLMIHGKNIKEVIHETKISKEGFKFAEGIILKAIHTTENPNYVFLDLTIEKNAKPGIRKIDFVIPGTHLRINYQLKPRRKGNGTEYAQGVRSQDFMYLIMPDRFANGDYSNDKLPQYKDQSLNRDSMYHRHGGDIQGVIDHLDYLKDLGITTVWLTPILENDMLNRTEHGYAITNHYQVDKRHGNNELYKKLGDELHKRGMKLIQDAVYNHIGIESFLYRDAPDSSWFHRWPVYTQSTYKDQPLMDPHASAIDKKRISNGWFGGYPHMPDVDQTHPFFANFLIQHAIWSVEEFGVDGWRIDTYIYNDLDFMNRCNKALTDEFPKITMFGETWVHGTANQAYFAQNNINTSFKSNLIGVTDFQTNMYGINPALTQNFGWTEGVNKLYQTLSNDYLYKDPMNNVNFLDNHDMSRFISQVNEDVDKLKMGIGWLLTSRGIPEMYYGTEILLKGVSNPDGLVRGDFWGGWKEDKENKFTQAGRTEKENEVFNWTKTIANFRKNSSAIKTGKLMQYVPEDWVYTYFRYDDKQTVMVIMNTSNDEKTIDVKRFEEKTKGFTQAKNIVTSATDNLSASWKIPGKTIWVLELKK
jgi:glycosidase